MSLKVTAISNGVDGLFLSNDRFNTTRISFNFYLPLERETVANNALLPFVLTTCSEKYPDFSKLNYKLSKLYGARLESSCEKTGDFQLLRVCISTINDSFALDGESLVEEACEMLLNLIFNPKVENGAFCDEDVSREKRKAIEHIKSELSEKRIYAKNRMLEEMYKGEKYGIPKCGTEDDVNAITGETLYKAWKEVLKSAYIRVQVVSSTMPSGLFDKITDRFSSIERDNITVCDNVSPTKALSEAKTITETMNVSQGQLVMGFSSELYGDGDNALPLMVMTDIFGGGPYSRLFTNVREKMSLCYYCSASSVRIKGLVMVDSGVEAENFKKAQEEILNQLEIIKQNKFSDFEFESSLKSIKDSLNSYNDSQTSIDTWYSIRVFDKDCLSPEEMAEKLTAVSREDIARVANGVKLNTVYRLMPENAGERK